MIVSFIGGGNVSFHLSRAFTSAGIPIECIVLKNDGKGPDVFAEMRLLRSEDLRDLRSDIIFIAVPDDKIAGIINEYKFPENAILAHTSGSVPIDVFEGSPVKEYGCFYPLQTLSKSREISYDDMPVFIEGSSVAVTDKLLKVGSLISGNVNQMDSQTRLKVHLAAVIASNFTNHMFHLSSRILENEALHFEQLAPLVKEAVDKAIEIGPGAAQTGPARRGDVNTLKKHISIIEDTGTKAIYELISQQIVDFYRHSE